MRFPKVTNVIKNDAQTRVYFTATENLDWFKGHFSGIGILPGVAITMFVAEFVSRYSNLNCNKEVSGIPQAKFVNIVFPNTELCLILIVDLENNFVKYDLKSADEQTLYSTGKLSCRSEGC